MLNERPILSIGPEATFSRNLIYYIWCKWHRAIVYFNSSCAYVHGDWIFQLVILFYWIDLGTDPKSLNCDDVCKAILFYSAFL